MYFTRELRRIRPTLRDVWFTWSEGEVHFLGWRIGGGVGGLVALSLVEQTGREEAEAGETGVGRRQARIQTGRTRPALT